MQSLSAITILTERTYSAGVTQLQTKPEWLQLF